jgi:hypothetical protein
MKLTSSKSKCIFLYPHFQVTNVVEALGCWTAPGQSGALGSSTADDGWGTWFVDDGGCGSWFVDSGWPLASSTPALPVGGGSTAAGHLPPRRRLWQLVRGRRLGTCPRCRLWQLVRRRRFNGDWALASSTPARHLRRRRRLNGGWELVRKAWMMGRGDSGAAGYGESQSGCCFNERVCIVTGRGIEDVLNVLSSTLG